MLYSYVSDTQFIIQHVHSWAGLINCVWNTFGPDDWFIFRANCGSFFHFLFQRFSANDRRMCKWYWSIIFPWAKWHWTVIKFILLKFNGRIKFSCLYILAIKSPPKASQIDLNVDENVFAEIQKYQLHVTFSTWVLIYSFIFDDLW